MRTQALAAAERGYAFLKREDPAKVERIDLGVLDIGCPWNCNLGQMYDEYNRGLSILELTRGDAVRLGFSSPDPRNPLHYEALNWAWREVISADRADRIAA